MGAHTLFVNRRDFACGSIRDSFHPGDSYAVLGHFAGGNPRFLRKCILFFPKIALDIAVRVW